MKKSTPKRGFVPVGIALVSTLLLPALMHAANDVIGEI
jgi:hypothetical protein